MVDFYDGIVDLYDEADLLSGVTFHPYGRKVLRGLSVQAPPGELTVGSTGGLRRSLGYDLIRQLKQTAKHSVLNKRIA